MWTNFAFSRLRADIIKYITRRQIKLDYDIPELRMPRANRYDSTFNIYGVSLYFPHDFLTHPAAQ